jgi:hypothetical protein
VAPKGTDFRQGLGETSLDELYAAPLEEFVARRNELARTLGRAEAKEAASWVKALPKPVATAWAVNRLVQERGDEIVALRVIGDRLRSAQAAGDREALREIGEQRRERVGALVDQAAELLRGGGHQDSVQALQRVRRTLEAIAVWGSAAELEPPPGRLHADLEPPGFETLLGLPMPAARAPPVRETKAGAAGGGKRAASANGESAAARKAASARRLELQRAATLAAEQVEEARVASREAEVERERAERRAEDGERAVARQEERLREARASRDEALAQRRTAEREAAAAAKLLEKRRAELAAAQGRLRDLT